MTHYKRAEIWRPYLHALVVALAPLLTIIAPSSLDAGKSKAHSESLMRMRRICWGEAALYSFKVSIMQKPEPKEEGGGEVAPPSQFPN